jgi:hypothetical protein
LLYQKARLESPHASLLSIFREVRDPRDFNARHELPTILFIALAATLLSRLAAVGLHRITAERQVTNGKLSKTMHDVVTSKRAPQRMLEAPPAGGPSRAPRYVT